MRDLPVLVDTAASLDTFSRGLHETVYRGVKVWKLAADLDRYRRVIDATRPELIVETGTRWGGSALWFAAEFGLDVVTVDVERVDAPAAWARWPITAVHGSSIDRKVIGRVAELAAGRRTMVSLDSDHHAPHVYAEIAAYRELVTPGCYLVVEDAIFDYARTREEGRRGGRQLPVVGGPLGPIRDLLAPDPRWERDEAVEQMSPTSYYPAGWWVRRG